MPDAEVVNDVEVTGVHRITTIHQESAPANDEAAAPASEEMEGMDHSQHQMAMPEMEKKS